MISYDSKLFPPSIFIMRSITYHDLPNNILILHLSYYYITYDYKLIIMKSIFDYESNHIKFIL